MSPQITRMLQRVAVAATVVEVRPEARGKVDKRELSEKCFFTMAPETLEVQLLADFQLILLLSMAI